MVQNISHAVMAQRTEDADSLDDFPTPPWATRALLKHILIPRAVSYHTVLEPACGRGHMAKALGEYFQKVTAFDIADYGYAKALKCRDFTTVDPSRQHWDWVITNPPFNRAEQFIATSLAMSKKGVAIFIRSTFAESIGRFNRIYSICPPTIIAQFAERVVLHKGRLSPGGSTATAYCWLVWYHGSNPTPGFAKYQWIPPCRDQLERMADYKR